MSAGKGGEGASLPLCTHDDYHYMTDPTVILEADSDVPPTACLIESGLGSFNFGAAPNAIYWERFYEVLDMQHGFDMQDLGGPMDNKIKRIVRTAVNEGEVY